MNVFATEGQTPIIVGIVPRDMQVSGVSRSVRAAFSPKIVEGICSPLLV